MSFTEAQRVKIRLFLGFPDVFQGNNPRLESAFIVLGGRPDTQTRVESILAEIDGILPKLGVTVAGGLISYAGIKKADEVEFFSAKEGGATTAQDSVKKLGRMWIGQLSIMFGVPVQNDIFSGRGYQGDAWTGVGFQYGGGNGSGGGVIPLG